VEFDNPPRILVYTVAYVELHDRSAQPNMGPAHEAGGREADRELEN